MSSRTAGCDWESFQALSDGLLPRVSAGISAMKASNMRITVPSNEVLHTRRTAPPRHQQRAAGCDQCTGLPKASFAGVFLCPTPRIVQELEKGDEMGLHVYLGRGLEDLHTPISRAQEPCAFAVKLSPP